MADGTIDSIYITLKDNWPGVARPLAIENFKKGVSNWPYHNVAAGTPGMPKLGEKYLVYNRGLNSKGQVGYSTLIYLKVGTQNPDVAIAARSIVTSDDADGIYTVSNDPDTVIQKTGSPYIALALSAMTNAYYGYFWCGGVAPADEIVSGTTYVTDGNILTDASVAVAYGIEVGDCAGDFLGFSVHDGAGSACVGISGADDTNT